MSQRINKLVRDKSNLYYKISESPDHWRGECEGLSYIFFCHDDYYVNCYKLVTRTENFSNAVILKCVNFLLEEFLLWINVDTTVWPTLKVKGGPINQTIISLLLTYCHQFKFPLISDWKKAKDVSHSFDKINFLTTKNCSAHIVGTILPNKTSNLKTSPLDLGHWNGHFSLFGDISSNWLYSTCLI